jgi:hypothetical protein
VTIVKVTDIDVLRFVDTDRPVPRLTPQSRAYFNASDFKAGGLSPTLKVIGSEAASPFSENGITLSVDRRHPVTTIGLSAGLLELGRRRQLRQH